jgi:hypothetical protein
LTVKDLLHRLVLAAALAVGAAGPARAQTIQDQAPRPPPLPPEQGCELWRGTSSGNDPSVELEVRLCTSGPALTGVIQWSSTRSGWNRRSLAGEVIDGGTRVVMRDLAILEQRPQPGWRFCTVDRYELVRSPPDVLGGRYDSEACADHGRLDLRLVGTAPRDAAPVPPAPAPSPGTPPPPPPAPPAAGCGGCAAGGSEAPRDEAWLFALLLVLVGTTARARADRPGGRAVRSRDHGRDHDRSSPVIW